MITILAGLVGLVGVFFVATSFYFSYDNLVSLLALDEPAIKHLAAETEHFNQQMEQARRQGAWPAGGPTSPETFIRLGMTFRGALMVGLAVALYLSAMFANRGSTGAVRLAIVVVCLGFLFLIFQVVGAPGGLGIIPIVLGASMTVQLLLSIHALRHLSRALKAGPQIAYLRKMQVLRPWVWLQLLPPDDGEAGSAGPGQPHRRPQAAMAGPFAPFAIAGGFGYAQGSPPATGAEKSAQANKRTNGSTEPNDAASGQE
jgi:hypothetical protein